MQTSQLLLQDGCSLPNCFDAPEAAQAFSQFSGVMTGFAVAVAVLLIERVAEHRSGRGSPDARWQRAHVPLMTVVASVAALAIATFCYSVVAGVEEPSPKAQSQYLVATTAFVIAGSLLVHGMWQLLIEFFDGRVAAKIRVVVIGLVPLGFIYLIVTAADVTNRVDEVGDLSSPRLRPLWAGLVLLILLAVWCIKRPILVSGSLTSDERTWTVLAGAGLLVTVLEALIFTTWVASLKSLDRSLPQGASNAIVLLALVYFALFMVSLPRGESGRSDSPEAGSA